MNESHDAISGGQLARALRRRWWIVVQVVLAGAAVGALLAVTTPERYEATATVLIESALRGGAGEQESGRLTAEAAARLVSTQAVARRVARRLDDRRTAGELLADVSARARSEGAFVDVTARDDTPRGAIRLANAFSEQFIAARSASVAARAQRAIAAAERQLSRLPEGSRERARLRSEVSELRAAAALRGLEAELIDPAVGATEINDDVVITWPVIGAALGLLLGLALALTLTALDPRIRTLSELRRLVGAPQLAALPKARRRRRGTPPVLAADRQPFEQLRGALLVGQGRERLRRIVVTSPDGHDDGRTPVAANLALSLARLGLRVCAVDADLGRPSLASNFGLDDRAPGLADALRDEPLDGAIQHFAAPADEAASGSDPGATRLCVIAAGRNTDGAAELLAGNRVEEVFEALARAHDVVIIDSPLTASNALSLVERASATILVVRHSRTQRDAVVRATSVISNVNGSLLGVVVTGVPKDELAAEGAGAWPAPRAAASAHDG